MNPINKEQIMAYVKRNKTLLAGVAGAALVLVSFGAYALLPEHSADTALAEPARYEAPERNGAAAPPPRMM
jgi:serine protease Do